MKYKIRQILNQTCSSHQQQLDGQPAFRCSVGESLQHHQKHPWYFSDLPSPRAIVYAAKGNRRQARRCWQVKISNINPYKCVKNIVKGIAALKCDLKVGIWIGKRNLGYFPFGLSVVPGYDLMHRPVMINHTIYEASGADSEGYCVYSISEYPGEGENFEWFVTDLEPLLSKNKPFQGCQEKIQSELSF